jgi:hypothetical protein
VGSYEPFSARAVDTDELVWVDPDPGHTSYLDMIAISKGLPSWAERSPAPVAPQWRLLTTNDGRPTVVRVAAPRTLRVHRTSA